MYFPNLKFLKILQLQMLFFFSRIIFVFQVDELRVLRLVIGIDVNCEVLQGNMAVGCNIYLSGECCAVFE